MIAEVLVFRILKARIFALKRQQHVTSGTFTMLGNDNLRHTMQVAAIIILIDMIVFRTMYENHHVGILLDGT